MGQEQKEEEVYMNRGGGRKYVVILPYSELFFGKIYQLWNMSFKKNITLFLQHSLFFFVPNPGILFSHCFRLVPWLTTKTNQLKEAQKRFNVLSYWKKLPNRHWIKSVFLMHGITDCQLGIKLNFFWDFEFVLEFLVPYTIHLFIKCSPYSWKAIGTL